MRVSQIRPRFVDFIPDRLEEGVLYISERYRTCSHLCCCGCGEEVVTPLSPAEWQVRREGDTVSLWPSVGNWDYKCRSHYVIRHNKVLWAGQMTARQIERIRKRDVADLERLTVITNARKASGRTTEQRLVPEQQQQRSKHAGPFTRLIRRLLDFWHG